MNRAELVFAAIDVLFHPFQNYIKVADVITESDISYNKSESECLLDLYYKKSDEALPVLVNIHGGGFVKGDKKHRKSISLLYADRGWFVVNVNYRLSPKSVFPTAVSDIISVLNYLPELAKKHNINLGKVVLTGDSSGAYLSMQTEACLTSKELREKTGIPECNQKIAAIVAYCGIYDVMRALESKIPFGIAQSVAGSYLGMKFDKKFSNKSDYKYIDYISPSMFVNENFCPSFLTYANKDIFCKGQGELMCEKLKSCNVPVDYANSTKLIDNHCYHFNFWTKTSKETMKKAFAFLEKIRVEA